MPRATLVPSSGGWNDLVVFCAGTPWDGHRLGAQHIAERLAAITPVLYVDPPIARRGLKRKPFLRQAVEGASLRVLGPRLARLSTLVPPGKTRPGLRGVAERLFRRQIGGAVDQLGARVLATIVAPPHFDVFGVRPERHRVHLASDDFLAGARMQGVSSSWVARREREVARSADLIVATSPVLVEKWRRLGHDPLLIPNGCDYATLETVDDVRPAPDVHLKPPLVGFIGTLSERIDVRLLDGIAELGHSLLLVGPRSFTARGQALDALVARPNVQWVGPRPFVSIPRYLAEVAVGIVPYADTPFNRASFPLKALDYLAAGRGVVSTDLPSMRWLETDEVVITQNQHDFIKAVDEALADPLRPSDVRARRAVARRHSWDDRVTRLACALGLS